MSAPLEPAYLDPYQPECHFPDVSLALEEPDGLLAVGGNLSAETLFNAYRHGIFPWYSDGQPILWWSPNPRAVIYPERLRMSRSLKKRLRQQRFEITLDHAFDEVIQACATARNDGLGTWITAQMQHAYIEMHRLGHAHSVEAWRDGKLVGGLYGIAIGQVFFGESMFSRESDASKVAFTHLVAQLKKWQFSLVDCQVGSSHMSSLGAEEIARTTFIEHIGDACNSRSQAPEQWKSAL
ncbi:MAG: leucyl/phenylalanyl-tRNA--protein transferase [Gammaproteobacteria bacterium]|nr:leucyl/phenylalanyl-tRNA--protein transferase [Gammaproteobacteria bacterium]